MSFRSDSLGPSALRINVIGAQTAEPESANPYTVYRTVSTHGGQCYERLVRYSEFLWFYKRLKFTDKNKSIKTFPKKKWTRKKSMEDEVIEARQVMLNEFMRDVCRSELTPESEQCLFKLLKMGKYDDGCGRVSELRGSLGASFLKSNRGDRSARRGPLDVVHEDDEEGDKVKPTTELAAAATLTATSVAFPAISSNATTVLTEEERSAIRSFRADDFPEGESSGAIVLSEELSASTDGDSRENPRPAPHKSVSSIPPSSYSAMVLDRPQLKASQSLPSSRRSKHVEFPNEPPVAPVSAPVKTDDIDLETPENDGSISPEKKYRDRINTHLSTISRLLSESETETEDLESARSIQTIQSVPLTA